MTGHSKENVPQRLKPHYKCGTYGTAEAVPLSKAKTLSPGSKAVSLNKAKTFSAGPETVPLNKAKTLSAL